MVEYATCNRIRKDDSLKKRHYPKFVSYREPLAYLVPVIPHWAKRLPAAAFPDYHTPNVPVVLLPMI